MMEVEVVDIRKSNLDSKLKAFANVKFGEYLLIRGFSVMDGPKGAFVKVPSKLAKDGRWMDTIAIEGSLKHEVEARVLEAYNKEIDGVDS